MNLPPEFDPDIYRSFNPDNPDLAHMNHEMLEQHYRSYGKVEGRVCSRVDNRIAFANLIEPEISALEIAPFVTPLLHGPNTFYFDAFGEEAQRRQATYYGYNPDDVPQMHYTGCLDDIPRTFQVILSSHLIEHQPDLIGHLLQVERRLEPGGQYFLVIPDKRYCFDRFNAPSTIADVIEAHEQRRTVHSLKSLITYEALRVHNEPARHWAEKDLLPPAIDPEKIMQAVQTWRSSGGTYVDSHGWYFTPDSFREIIDLTGRMGLIEFSLERLYPTPFGSNEFWTVLKKS